jgi:hypothetical protein
MSRPGRWTAIVSAVACFAVSSGAMAQASRVGGEFQVNTTTPGDQDEPKVGRSENGSFVVAWTSADQSGHGVFAQRFASSGAPLAAEFQINVYTFDEQYVRGVAVDGDGDFVVVWTSFSQDGSDYGIFARRFNSAGSPLAAEFQVSTFTVGAAENASIAMKLDGAFVIAWGETGRDGSSGGIFARRFDSAGVAQGGGDTLVNTYTSGDQDDPSVGIAGDGSFVVTWTDASGLDGLGRGVFARRFTSSGAAAGGHFQISTYTLLGQLASRVAVNSGGSFVVAWQSPNDGDLYGVFARRFDPAGVASGREFLVNTYTTAFQAIPVATINDDGAFVIVWQSSFLDGFGEGVFARRFDAAGVPESGRELQVNSFTTGNQNQPAIGGDAAGDFVVAWHSDGQDGGGIFAQQFVVPKPFDIDGNGVTDALTDGLLFLRSAFGFGGAALVTGAVAVNCVRCTPALVADYIATLTTTSMSSPVSVEFQVNAYTEDEEVRPSVAADDNGDFVVTWHSPHDGSSYGVFLRRYASSGATLSGEVEVNTYVTGSQAFPVVDLDADGDFVVVWQSYQDGDETGIFAQRFDSSGAPQGAELRVNTHTGGFQITPAVAVDADGDFVVAWASRDQDGDDYGVFARRFNAAGVAQAAEFQISTYTAYDQYEPAIAATGAGGFVVVWQSAQDGSSYGVFGQRFNAAGVPAGSEFQVNAYTNNTQGAPSIAVNDGGAFVVAWSSVGQDGNYYGVFGRRFNAAGTPQGGEFQINTRTVGGQSTPVVDVDSSGEFLVGWVSYGQDGAGSGVFARRFAATGVPVAAEFQVNVNASDEQTWPAVAVSAGPTFVIAWQSNNQDGAGYGVFARRFSKRISGDVDGDGAVAPLTDGLLVLRFMFGFRGAALINSAVGPNCTRCTAPAIESWIASKV